MSEGISEIAQIVFLVTGAVFLFFSGFVVSSNTCLSFILLVLGLLCIMIRVNYDKEEVAE